MRGEHDDSLQWPLVGTVTFELLNQLGNHTHRKQTCSFDKDNHRVVDRDIAAFPLKAEQRLCFTEKTEV